MARRSGSLRHTGLQVIHQLITPEMARNLRGTIVAIPALSPTGLQMAKREPYYHDGWIISRTHGVVRYPHEATLSMAIRDDSVMVGPYPDDYFKA